MQLMVVFQFLSERPLKSSKADDYRTVLSSLECPNSNVSGWRTHLDVRVVAAVGRSAVMPRQVGSDASVILQSNCSCAWAAESAHLSGRHTGYAH